MSVTGRVTPKNLETATVNGALFVRVFDANGVPVQGAQVNIQNNKINPAIIINDVTDSQGLLQIVDAPPGNLAYEITVSKQGYTTDKTYSSSTINATPVKPHATVIVQQVTQISFVIDRVSTANIHTLTQSCATVPSIPFVIKGTKLIGTNPSVYKVDQGYQTDSFGSKVISNLE